MTQLIADSGATKCEWIFLKNGRKKSFTTGGISPYFMAAEQIDHLLATELLPNIRKTNIDAVHFYGTGLGNADNLAAIKRSLKQLFPQSSISLNTDLVAAARALCGSDSGLACILGTGSNSCFYNGKKIVKNSPGLGFILGDEGSGAYLGKKVVQYYLYNTYDRDLRARFDARFETNSKEILENVYRNPLPNRYLASFAIFLAENRGHYMVEEILERGLKDFFEQHLTKYKEAARYPINFIGGIAFGFHDILENLCEVHGWQLGSVMKTPLEGLVAYHKKNA